MVEFGKLDADEHIRGDRNTLTGYIGLGGGIEPGGNPRVKQPVKRLSLRFRPRFPTLRERFGGEQPHFLRHCFQAIRVSFNDFCLSIAETGHNMRRGKESTRGDAENLRKHMAVIIG